MNETITMAEFEQWAEQIAKKAFHNGWRQAMLSIGRLDLAELAPEVPEGPANDLAEGLTGNTVDL
jgi:hypothetical protein